MKTFGDRTMRRVLAGMIVLASAALSASTPDFESVLEEATTISQQGHWRDAQALLDELAPFLAQANPRDQVRHQLLQARFFVLDDRSEEALALAESLLDRNLDLDQRLWTLQFHANTAVLLRRYEAAFDSLGEALRAQAELDDPAEAVATLNMAAYMLGRVGEHALGADYGEQALALARESGQARDACIALQRLAPVYKWADRVEESEASYRQGIEECQAASNPLFVGVHQYGLADLLRREGRAGAALPLAEAAIEALDEGAYTLGEYEARLIRAEIRLDLDVLTDDDLEELDRLSSFFDERELWDQSARLAQLRSRQAELGGDPTAALQFLRDRNAARERFLDRERAMRLAYLQVEFDSRFQQQQIELLREATRAAQLEANAVAQQRRLQTVIWLLVVLVVATLLTLLYRAFRSRRKILELSRQDGLSGLANHTWFFERAQVIIDEFRSLDPPGQTLVLIAADIDHFKRVNDRYGHRVGDSVLGRTARLLREVFPRHALVGRVGGEEFAVLLQASSVEDAIEHIEQFRSNPKRSIRAGDPQVTVSFGLSCLMADDDVHSLRNRADNALYQAKEAGRDRVEIDPGCPARGTEPIAS
jgi:diguanylate cyclase (GGDEF)-like protein